MGKKGNQSDKFKEAAGRHDADEDQARWEERLKRVVRSKADPAPPSRDPIVRKDPKPDTRE